MWHLWFVLAGLAAGGIGTCRTACAKTSCNGKALLSDTHTRRAVTRTCAPIFNNRVRIVPQVACASCVPANPTARNWFTSE